MIMKTMNFEQMEKVNGGGWWECAFAVGGAFLNVALLPATAPIGWVGVVSLVYSLGQAGY